MGLQYPTPEDIKKTWDYNLSNHKPTDEGIARIEKLRLATKTYVNAVLDLTPPSREQSLALTNIETGNFYAVAAIARNETEDKQ